MTQRNKIIMISITYIKNYCQDYQNIQNYAEALKSPLKYDLHHRREISENKSRKQLIAENLYYNRPPEELVFLERGEHQRLHKEGKNMSAETRKKMSEAQKGHLVSEDTRQKISDAKKGKNMSAETRKRMSNAKKNMSEETRKKMSDAKKGKLKGLHWHLENGHRVWTE